MALAKQVKKGGSYYKGFELIISSSAGDYILDMTQVPSCVINSLSIVPDEYGAGDNFTVTHLSSDTQTTIAVLAETIYNPGANTPTCFDFPALEQMDPGEILRLTYTNTAGNAVNVHTIVEYAGIRLTT